MLPTCWSTLDFTTLRLILPSSRSCIRNFHRFCGTCSYWGRATLWKIGNDQRGRPKIICQEKGHDSLILCHQTIFRKAYLRRDILRTAEKTYLDTYGDKNGNIPMTLQVIWYMGWKAHSGQK